MTSNTVETTRRVLTASLKGPLIRPESCPMHVVHQAEKKGCAAIILNLSGVDYINSIGISVLMENFKYLKARGIEVVICSVKNQVLKVLRLARTDIFIPVAENYFVAKKMLTEISRGNTRISQEYILIIQHKNLLRSTLKNVLSDAKQDKNYVLRTVNSIDRSWDLMQNLRINMVIMDVTLERNTAQAFIEKVRTTDTIGGTPIYIAADHGSLFHASQFIKNGADDILLLPFNQYSTLPHIRTGLSQYKTWKSDVEKANPFVRETKYTQFIQG